MAKRVNKRKPIWVRPDRPLTLTLRLSQEDRDLLERIAAEEDRSLTTIMFRSLRLYAKENGHG